MARKRMSQREAVRLTGCRPNGVTINKLQRIFNNEGFTVRPIDLRGGRILRSLKAGRIVVIDDNKTWDDPHVVLVCGRNNEVLNIFDSMANGGQGGRRRRKVENVISDATEAFEIWGTRK